MNTTKRYVHKTLGWIAKEKTNGDYRIYKQDMGLEKDIMDYVHCNLFVDSQDREEVVEKDWISKLYLDIGDYVAINDDIPNEMMFRASIEQHMPKEKKFSKQDIWKIADNFTANNEYRFQVIQDFLKSNNLLSYTVD